MNEGLVAELCSLVEDYKRRDAALVSELATVNAKKNDLRRDCDELLTVLRHTDVYVNEVEEAVANLDRELARVQAAYTSADEELYSLRKLLRETHLVNHELWSLRQETKRLQVVVTEKETELNEYESIIEKQQSDILQLTFLVTEFESGRKSSVIVGKGRSPRENRHPPSIAEAMPCAPQSPLLQAALLRHRELRDRTRDQKDDKWVNNGKKQYDSILMDLDKEISSKALSDLEHRSRFLARSRRIRSIGGAKAYLEKTWGEDVQTGQATPASEDELDHGWIGLGSGLHDGTRWRRRGTCSSGSSIVVPCDNDDSASSYER